MQVRLTDRTVDLTEHLLTNAKASLLAAAPWLKSGAVAATSLPQMDFRWWQCEGLLAQTAQLLDRAMTERRELRQLRDQYARRAADVVMETAQVRQLTSRQASNPRKAVIRYLSDGARSAIDAANSAQHQNEGAKSTWQLANAQGYALQSQVAEQEARDTYETAIEEATKDRLESLAGEDGQDGAFDFATRANALSVVILDDFKDAIARSMASSVGLKRVYDNFSWLQQKVPDFPSFTNDQIDAIETLAAWVRQAARCISVCSELDQARTLVIDIPARLGSAEWTRLSETFANTGKVTFELDVPMEAFGDCSNVRIRGLTMTQDGDVPLVADARLPSLSPRRVRHGRMAIEDMIAQGDLPGVHFGRIHSISANRTHDVLGAQSVVNGSPTGTWKFALTARAALFKQQGYGVLPDRLLLEVIAAVLPASREEAVDAN